MISYIEGGALCCGGRQVEERCHCCCCLSSAIIHIVYQYSLYTGFWLSTLWGAVSLFPFHLLNPRVIAGNADCKRPLKGNCCSLHRHFSWVWQPSSTSDVVYNVAPCYSCSYRYNFSLWLLYFCCCRFLCGCTCTFASVTALSITITILLLLALLLVILLQLLVIFLQILLLFLLLP